MNNFKLFYLIKINKILKNNIYYIIYIVYLKIKINAF